MYVYRNFSSTSYEDAEQLLKQGKFKESIELLEKLLEKDERNPDVNFLLGLNYEKIGDFSSAIMYYKRILKFGRYNQRINEILVRTHLANSYLNIENFTEAKNEYLILTQIEPSNAEHYFNVGKIFFKGKLYSNAIKFLKQAIEINSRHFESFSIIGKCFFYQRIFSEAKNYLEKAKELNPKEPENLYYLAQTLRYLGEFNKAIEVLEIVEKEQKLRGKALLLKGLILLDSESYTQAINELEKSISFLNKASNDDLLAHYLIAAASEKMKNISKAIENWEYIHQIQPNFKDVSEKLKFYSDYKTSDAIKDLLISNSIQFETYFRKILNKLNLKPLLVNLDNNSTITAVCINLDSSPNRIQKNTLVRLFRETSIISENQIREFHDKMKIENAQRGIFLSVSDFSSSAVDYCTNRPIDLMNSKKVAQLLEN